LARAHLGLGRIKLDERPFALGQLVARALLAPASTLSWFRSTARHDWLSLAIFSVRPLIYLIKRPQSLAIYGYFRAPGAPGAEGADQQIVAAVSDALAKRHPKSRSRGRLGTPAHARFVKCVSADSAVVAAWCGRNGGSFILRRFASEQLSVARVCVSRRGPACIALEPTLSHARAGCRWSAHYFRRFGCELPRRDTCRAACPVVLQSLSKPMRPIARARTANGFTVAWMSHD